MSTKRIALAAAAGSTMLFTDCASWFQFEPPKQDDLASCAEIQDRFDYFDDASYACNLYNTLSDGDSHCWSLDRHAGKANNPRSPDFATANRAASLALAAGSMLGFVDGSGLIDVFSLGWGTPSHKGTLTAYENSVQGMFVIPAKDYPDASTAIRAYFKKLGSSIAQACKAIGCECERYDDALGDFFAHK